MATSGTGGGRQRFVRREANPSVPEERGAAPMALLRRSIVNKAVISLLAAAALPLAACTSTDGNSNLATVGTGAGIGAAGGAGVARSEEHTSELQSRPQLVCRLLLEKKNK